MVCFGSLDYHVVWYMVARITLTRTRKFTMVIASCHVSRKKLTHLGYTLDFDQLSGYTLEYTSWIHIFDISIHHQPAAPCDYTAGHRNNHDGWSNIFPMRSYWRLMRGRRFRYLNKYHFNTLAEARSTFSCSSGEIA